MVCLCFALSDGELRDITKDRYLGWAQSTDTGGGVGCSSLTRFVWLSGKKGCWRWWLGEPLSVSGADKVEELVSCMLRGAIFSLVHNGLSKSIIWRCWKVLLNSRLS